MTEEEIGKSVRLAMAHKGISGKDLAKAMDVVPLTISKWRQGRCKDIIILTQLAEACDMTFSEMMALA